MSGDVEAAALDGGSTTSKHAYLSTADAAQHLGVSKGFLDRARLTGGGPVFCAFGRVVRYRLSDLDDWAAGRRWISTTQRLGSNA